MMRMSNNRGTNNKDLHQAMEAHKQQLDVLGQTVNQAGKTEQVRFQTLDGAVRGRVEVMENKCESQNRPHEQRPQRQDH